MQWLTGTGCSGEDGFNALLAVGDRSLGTFRKAVRESDPNCETREESEQKNPCPSEESGSIHRRETSLPLESRFCAVRLSLFRRPSLTALDNWLSLFPENLPDRVRRSLERSYH